MRSVVLSTVHASSANEKTDDYFDVNLSHLCIYEDAHEIDYAVLVACGLLQKVETEFFRVGNGGWSVLLTYYLLTSLGFSFALACKMVPIVPGWTGPPEEQL